MQKKLSMLLVLVLTLSLVFCFGASVWAAEEINQGTVLPEGEEDPIDDNGDPIEEDPIEEDPIEEDPTEEDPIEEVPGVFTDVPAEYWAYEYIMDIYERELTTGTSATTFGPEASLTRAQFVTFLGRLAGVDVAVYADAPTPFEDISEAANMTWAYGYICWAAEIGVTTGATTTTFNPQGQLTREQMATMVKRFADFYGVDLGVDEPAAMSDADDVSEYATAAVSALASTYINLIDGKFAPQAQATRAQMAQVLSLFPVPDAGFVVPVEDEDPVDEEPIDEEPADEESPVDEEPTDEETDEIIK